VSTARERRGFPMSSVDPVVQQVPTQQFDRKPNPVPLSLLSRCGGHSFMGYSARDGTLGIDLSRLNRVTVSPDRRTARVQGGTKQGQLYYAVWKQAGNNTAVVGGTCPTVGVGGFLQGELPRRGAFRGDWAGGLSGHTAAVTVCSQAAVGFAVMRELPNPDPPAAGGSLGYFTAQHGLVSLPVISCCIK